MSKWRTLARFPDYLVSESGDVRRCRPSKNNKQPGPIRPFVNERGYSLYALITAEGFRKTVRAHQLVCEAWHGPKPSEKHCVAHNDGNPGNNHFSNLRWATVAENIADTKVHGTRLYGERTTACRLKADQVRAIRKRFVEGASLSQMGRDYGVVPNTIRDVVIGRTWGTVK